MTWLFSLQNPLYGERKLIKPIEYYAHKEIILWTRSFSCMHNMIFQAHKKKNLFWDFRGSVTVNIKYLNLQSWFSFFCLLP